MATYDYKCESCGQTFEIVHSIKESPRTKCPDCGKNSLKRLISTGIGAIFKGAGFWCNDRKKSISGSITDRVD
jgi:putative FmdB family regulatory protein